MSILVIGGTGTVGPHVVAGLLARGERVRVMTRAAERVAGLPEGVEGVVGDLRHPETLGAACAGAQRMFLLTALSPSEADDGIAAVRAARAARVERLVYMSVYGVETCPQAPHFHAKIEIQRALEDEGVPHTVIMPNSLFQNDLCYRELLLDAGVYPQPLGEVGVSRVDVRDVADAVVNALTDASHAGKRYTLAGPEPQTGPEIAAAWSRLLGREIRYGGDDLDAWSAAVRTVMPGWMADSLVIMYRHFQQHGLITSEYELARQSEILGRQPRRFEEFAAQTARSWTGSAG